MPTSVSIRASLGFNYSLSIYDGPDAIIINSQSRLGPTPLGCHHRRVMAHGGTKSEYQSTSTSLLVSGKRLPWREIDPGLINVDDDDGDNLCNALT